MCGKKSAPAPAPVPVPVPDPTIANRGSSASTNVGDTRRLASTDEGDGIKGGLSGGDTSAAPGGPTKSVLGG